MGTVTVDLNLQNNRVLGRLASGSYKSDYTNIPNSALTKVLRASINTIYNALTGRDLGDSDYTFTVVSEGGVFKKLYSPGVFGTEATDEAPAKLLIKFGAELIEVETKSKNYKVTFGQYDFSGRGEDAALFVRVKQGSDNIQMPFRVSAKSYDLPLDIAEMNDMAAEGDIAGLCDFLRNPPKTGGSGFDNTNSNSVTVSVKDLPFSTFTVESYRQVNASWGQTYILSLDAESSTQISPDKKIQVWADNQLRNDLELKPVMPATLVVLQGNIGKDGQPKRIVRFEAESFEEEVIDLDSVLFS